MEFLLGVGVTLYGLGFIGALLLFCLDIGLKSSYTNPPFLFRLIGAIFKAALWPISLPVMILSHRE